MSASKNLGAVDVSSIETEIAADGERFPNRSWFRCFRLAQCDSAKEDALIKDNESCIFVHKHHPLSVGKYSKHANVRYFFAVDKIN